MTAKTPPKRRARTAGAVDPKFAPVAAAFAGDRRVSRRKMFRSGSVLSVDGKIFAMLARGKFDPGHGRLMKEWIAVGAGRADWIALAKEAYRFVREGRSGLRGATTP
jgi:hypothetical protein